MVRHLLAAAALFLPVAAQAESVVVTADRMVDVLSGRVVEEPVVVITDGRIASVVGRGGARPIIPGGATRIDLPGKTILPGLIDMHVHLAGTPLIGGRRGLDYTDSFWATLGVPNAKAMLEAGFTTVDDLVHGLGGGYLPPVIGSRSRTLQPLPTTDLEAGMTVVVQPNVVLADRTAGVQTGEMFHVTESGSERLHAFPRGLGRIA